MSRARRSLNNLLVLLLFVLCPMQAIAQDEEWVRVDVFGGRASVEVPKSYKRAAGESLDHLRDMVEGRDGFYTEGMCKAWINTFDERRRHCSLAMSFGSSDSRAHFWVLELRAKLGNDGRAWLDTLCSEDQDMVSRETGTYFTYNDKDRGMTYCGGAGGAAAWFICKRVGGRRICVSGMDYVEIVKASRWRSNAPHEKRKALRKTRTDADAETLRNRFWHQANGPIIERVLNSFRYK